MKYVNDEQHKSHFSFNWYLKIWYRALAWKPMKSCSVFSIVRKKGWNSVWNNNSNFLFDAFIKQNSITTSIFRITQLRLKKNQWKFPRVYFYRYRNVNKWNFVTPQYRKTDLSSLSSLAVYIKLMNLNEQSLCLKKSSSM